MNPRFPSFAALTLAAACAHRPPEDFAPDPGLVSHIRSIEMRVPTSACPGEGFLASYTAILDDSSRVPFATRYDRKHPPRLHVVFLERWSPEAIPLEGGGWAADRDPLTSARTGFRLRAALRAKPSIADSVAIAPDYSCMSHTYAFSGATGETAQSGVDGPVVTVRLGVLRSPFYDRLLVAAIAAEEAPPLYLLADARSIPPADWLRIESRGGRGGRGQAGRPGVRGADGTTGCPGSPGGPGGPGGSGGPGAGGGRGGRITIIAPEEEPFLAGIVDARVPGGEGGPGGSGGTGGGGGAGGKAGPRRAPSDSTCRAGAAGGDGPAGRAGPRGPDGDPGLRAQVLTVPLRNVFGVRIPPELAELLEH
jgi:hypothetical protein